MIVLGKEVVQWIARRTNEFGCFGTDIGIGWARGGQLVAGVAYADWNGPNVVCHIAAEGKHWATRGYLGTIFDYPFNQLKVQRITVCVGEGNPASRRFVEHLGFTLEAELAGAHSTGHLRIYRLWRNECRYLKEPYANLHPHSLQLAA
jgi:RimJ/RimL family protein N-acetyltransferase